MEQVYGAMRTTLNMSRYHSRKVKMHLVMGRGTAWCGRRTCNAEFSGGFDPHTVHHFRAGVV